MMLGIDAVDQPRRPRDRPHRALQGFPVAGLALMSAALIALAVIAGHPSRTMTAIGLVVFGLGFGVVGQVLTVAVQNEVDRRQLGVAMATTSFFRGLGGGIGAAVLGAVFAARAGTTGGGALATVGAASRADVAAAAQTVFLVAAPIAVLALVIVLFLRERTLAAAPPGTHSPAPRGERAPSREPAAVAS